MATIGKIEIFDESLEEWATYVERVEQYFIANAVKENKRVPALLSLMGSTSESLTAPAKPSSKSFKDIVLVLQNHLSPNL